MVTHHPGPFRILSSSPRSLTRKPRRTLSAWLRCQLAATPGPTGVEGVGGSWHGHSQRRPIGGRREACGAWPGHSQRRPIGDRREACGAWPDHSQRRPVGGRREACGAWPGFETTRRAKLAARTASGRAGLAAAGDLAASRTKSGGPQENLGTTTHAFTDVN